jgi:dGTPase
LNLTFEVREGIVKHSRDLVPGANPDLEEYLPSLRPPLEAQLIDLADEIAYDCADLDDGYAAHMLTLDEILEAVPGFAQIFETVEMQYPGASEREQFQETQRSLINMLVSGLIEGTAAAAGESGARSCDDVRNLPARIAAFTPSAGDTVKSLKRFLRGSLYSSPVLADGRVESTRKMGELFDYFLEHPEELPDPHSSHVQFMTVQRAVCDYIAGMTDVFFRRTYDEIFENRNR